MEDVVLPKFWDIIHAIERPGVKKRWIRIGSATSYVNSQGVVGIMCTIEALPLQWNGEFQLSTQTGVEGKVVEVK